MDHVTNNFVSDSEKQAGCDGDVIRENGIITSAQECDTDLDTEVELTVRSILNSSICFIFITHIAKLIYDGYEFHKFLFNFVCCLSGYLFI